MLCVVSATWLSYSYLCLPRGHFAFRRILLQKYQLQKYQLQFSFTRIFFCVKFDILQLCWAVSATWLCLACKGFIKPMQCIKQVSYNCLTIGQELFYNSTPTALRFDFNCTNDENCHVNFCLSSLMTPQKLQKGASKF